MFETWLVSTIIFLNIIEQSAGVYKHITTNVISFHKKVRAVIIQHCMVVA